MGLMRLVQKKFELTYHYVGIIDGGKLNSNS